MRKVRVFVSSPGDVGNERRRLQEIAITLNGEFNGVAQLEIYRWEEGFYSANQTYQEQIPATWESDVVISIFWSRLGTPLRPDFRPRRADGSEFPDGLTGSTYELLTALDAARHNPKPTVYVFRKIEEPTFRISSKEGYDQAFQEWQKVGAFFDEQFRNRDKAGLIPFSSFETTDEFERLATDMLRDWIVTNVVGKSDAIWAESRGTPFPGLVSYDERHAVVYFGRARKVANAVRLFRAAADRKFPVLFIVGPSGAGKSSLMRAGLAPRLTTRGVVDGVDVWRTATMRPGDGASPFHALAQALIGPQAEAALPELRDGPFGEVETLAQQLSSANAAGIAPLLAALDDIGRSKRDADGYDRELGAGLLLLVDQFEDIFGSRFTDADRAGLAGFIKLAAETRRIWVACTLRADLYDRFIKTFIALQDRAAEYTLAPPGEAELAEIIEKTAAAAKLTYETDAATGKRLDEQLLNDSRGSDSLPLLQFALNSLYEARVAEGGKTLLTFAAYDRFGRIAGAINSAAEKALTGAFGDPPKGFERELERLLRALVVQVVDGRSSTVGQEALAIRPVPMEELPADPITQRLIDALTAARVLVTASRDQDDTPADGAVRSGRQATLAIAHERLLESWRRAKEIIAREKSYFQIRRNVIDQMRLWQHGGRHSAELIRSKVGLDAAVNLKTRYGDELPKELRAFIERSQRRARFWNFVYGGVAATFAGLAGIAGFLGWQANRNFEQAEGNYRVALEQVVSLIDQITTRLENTYGIQTSAVDAMLAVVDRSIERLRSGNSDPQLEQARGQMLYRFARVYRKNGRRGGSFLNSAEEKARQSFDIRQALAASWPENQRMLTDLADAYELLGEIFRDGFSFPLARASQEEALRLRELLFAADPQNPRRRLVLSYSHLRIGDVAVNEKKPAEAAERYRTGLTYMEALNAELPADHELRGEVMRELTWGLNKLGDLSPKETPEAPAYYERAACVRDYLAKADRTNALAADDLAFSLEKLSGLPTYGGVYRQATAFQALRIRLGLAKSDPYNTNWTYQHATSLWNVGRVKRDLRQSTAAYAFIWKGHSILQELAANTSYDDRRFASDFARIQVDLADAWRQLQDDGVKVGDGNQNFIEQVIALHAGAYKTDVTFPVCADLAILTSNADTGG